MDYIKLSRKILEWEWYGNINTCRLFIHMLLKAYWKDKKIEGTVIPRGSFPSSYGRLAEETQLTVDEVRTAVKHLISTKEITKHATSKYTVFTVNNYDAYQIIPSSFPTDSQTIPERFPTKEEYKEGNNKKKNLKVLRKNLPPRPLMVFVPIAKSVTIKSIRRSLLISIRAKAGWLEKSHEGLESGGKDLGKIQ